MLKIINKFIKIWFLYTKDTQYNINLMIYHYIFWYDLSFKIIKLKFFIKINFIQISNAY